MNKKIFAQLLAYSQNDLTKVTQPWIKETFGVEVKRCDTLEQYTDAIDDACLNRYFSRYWQNIPHATANASNRPRPMLVITGVMTDKTREILSKPIKKKI